MRRSLLRLLALPLAVGATAAAVVTTAGTAEAASTTIVAGTGTITVPASILAQLAKAGIAVVPQGAASLAYDSTTHTGTVVYNATGGDAQVNALAGSVDYSGGVKFCDIRTGEGVTFSALLLDMFNGQLDATSSVDGTQQVLLDTGGNVSTSVSSAGVQTFSADSLQIDAAGAAYLDSTLDTSYFTAGQVVGTFTTTYHY
jgi:hypothetical protein